MTLIDRLEPFANPILVRSLRQALRSRSFMGVYLIVLLVTGLAAVITSLMTGASQEGSAGHGLFLTTVIAWTFAAWFAQPLVALAAVVRERNEDTWVLVDLTGMRPRSVVSGLLATALVQAAVVGAGLAPFLVLSYQLRGVDIGLLLLAIIGIPSGTAVLAALAVLVGCLGTNRASRTVLGGLLTLGLAGLVFGMGAFWLSPYDGAEEVVAVLAEHAEAWLAVGMVATACLGAIYLCCVLAATLLTHPAQDRSSAGRLAVWVLWLAWLAWLVVVIVWRGAWHGEWDQALAFAPCLGATVGIGWAIVAGFFWVTEPEGLTRRQQQAVAAGGALFRAAMTILGPGAARGRRGFLLLVAANLLILAFSLGWFEGNHPNQVRSLETMTAVAIGLICYAACLLGPVSLALRAWGRSWFWAPVSLRGGLLAFTAVWFLFGGLGLGLLTGFEWDRLENPLMALVPQFGVPALVDDSLSWGSPTRLVVLAIGVISLGFLIVASSPRPGRGVRIVADPAGRPGEG